MRTVLTLLCGLVLLGAAGCATPGGVQIAGPASQVTPPPPPPTVPSGTPASADSVAIMRADPQINDKIKAQLVPCVAGSYPVEDRYADLTHDGTADLVVTVRGCPVLDEPAGVPPTQRELSYGGGYAAYVYDLATDPPTRLFGIEDQPVDAMIPRDDGGELLVLYSKWNVKDDPCCPSDSISVVYQWNGVQFVEVKR
jgi:hypothetical protein